MTQEELTEKIDFIRKRHNKRAWLVMGIFLGTLFSGFYGVELLGSHLVDPLRDISIFSVVGLCALVVILGMVKTYRLDKQDCVQHSVLCPHCGLHLYDWHRIMWGGASVAKTGKCRHCGRQLVNQQPN